MPPLPAALDGAKIFPCLPGDKLPALSFGWQTRATDDPAQIAAWQAGMENLNWGVACGPSGLFVIDIDPDGLEGWQAMQARSPELRDAIARSFTVRTPRGGYHHYFKGQGPTTAKAIGPGIDTRGGYVDERTGKLKSIGYVVLPGSKTKAGAKTVDGEYRWISGQGIEPIPAGVLAIMPERKRGQTLGLAADVSKDNPRNIQTARDLLENYLKDGRVSVEGKGGNSVAFQVACSVLDKGISPACCFALLDEVWNPHCSPPWDDWELETIVSNALKYGEETDSGAKGFQDNASAFAQFAGQEFEPDEPEKPKQRGRYKPMWLRDARKDVRPASWIIPGFIPSTGVGILYGLTGSYKTFIALDWALCLAHGIAGQWGAPPVKHNVLFLAGESSYALQQERVNAWCEAHGVQPDDGNFVIVRGVPAYADKEGWQEVRDGLAEMDVRPDFVVIDTLTRMLAGMDENSNNEAKLVLAHCEQISEHYNCFTLSTGHTGKDENRGLRGAQVFLDNSDAVIYAKKAKGGTTLTVKKLKEVDIPEKSFYLEMEKIGETKSIFLRRSENSPDYEAKSTDSKKSWSDVGEILDRLAKAGGKLGTESLALDISSALGIPKEKVKKELNMRTDIQFLREGNFWRVPSVEVEFDL